MPDQPEEAENPTQDLQSAADTTQSAAKTAANAAPTAMKGAGKAAQVSGKGLQAAGTGMQALAPIPVVGWISAGAGKGLAVAGKGLQAAGKGMEKMGGIMGKAKNFFGRITSRLARLLPVVGAILRVKDLIGKIPIIGPLINKLINKLGDISKKILMAVGLGIGYLLYMLLQLLTSIVGICMVAGAAIGGTIGFIIGGPAGAAVGASVGASVGAFIGTKINAAIGTAKSATSTAASIPGSITSGISGAISGLTGAVSGAFSAVTGTAGAIIGGIGGALGGILNAAAGAVTSSVGTVAVATVGAIGTVGAFQMAIGVPSTHFTTDADNPSAASAQNTFFKVTKSANRTTLPNSPPNNEVTFTITLTTTRNLSAVTVTDTISVQGPINFNLAINNDKDGKAISPIDCPKIIPAGQSCTRSFTIAVGPTFNDTTITNTVTATAVPEGTGIQTSSASFVVTVGSPPALCPRVWPTLKGDSGITQGPLGSTSHAKLAALGEQAIDIGVSYVPALATFNGVVSFAGTIGDGYGNYIDITGTCNGSQFRVRWAHLSSISPGIVPGTNVIVGQQLGTTGETGNVKGAHLHYSFFGLPMETPYIPISVAFPSCNSNTQCNVYW